MKKQVSVVLAAAIAGGLLAGCGSTKPAETTAAAGTNGAGETQAEAAAGDVTIDGKELQRDHRQRTGHHSKQRVPGKRHSRQIKDSDPDR